MSYAHASDNHKVSLFNKDGSPQIDIIKRMLANGESLFDNAPLELDNSIKLLPEVEKLRREESMHFI